MFAWLRPNDLIWNYVVNNYLLGKDPPAFDILYWNQDTVRLAAGLHRDFVHLALENSLTRPGALRRSARRGARAIDVDSYIVAGVKDHIVPWENAYRSTQLLGGTSRFVLSTSGHIQALVNPPGPDSRSTYRAVDEAPEDPHAWLRRRTETGQLVAGLRSVACRQVGCAEGRTEVARQPRATSPPPRRPALRPRRLATPRAAWFRRPLFSLRACLSDSTRLHPPVDRAGTQ